MTALAVGTSTPSAATPLQTFHFDKLPLRTTLRDGEVWFVASDVCAALGLDNNRQAVTRLDEDEKGVISNDTLGGTQQAIIVSESGLYSLILTSRKPEAKRFKRWVTHEVLPAIRKTGGYAAPAARQVSEEQGRALLHGHLFSRRFVVRLHPDEPIHLQPVPDAALIVDPANEAMVVELLRATPPGMLPRVLAVLVERVTGMLPGRDAAR